MAMRRFPRDTWLAIGLLVVLAITTAIAGVWQMREPRQPALSSHSNARDGTRALRLWLEQIGYRVSNDSGPEYIPPADTGVIIVLEPFYDPDGDHWLRLDRWVETGGTLIVAGDWAGAEQIFNHFDASTQARWITSGVTVTVQTPFLASPPLEDLNHLKPYSSIVTKRDDMLVLLASDGYPVLLTFRMGGGRVILAPFVYPFTNAGLKMTGNPELVLNLLALAGNNRSVWFDEWHHGLGKRAEIVGPQDWLRFTSAGHALLFFAIILFMGLLLQSRNFGRPIPLPHHMARRTPLEYITALANLNRRAGHRSQVLGQYRQSLKQGLAKRYRLDPHIPDAEYVRQLAKYNPALDSDGLQSLLKRLSKNVVSEGELVKLASETAGWLKDHV